MLSLNACATARIMRELAPGMVARGRGRILVIGSIVSVSAQPTNAVYAASKAFLASLCRTLHYELGLAGVGVTLLTPGATSTEFGQVSGCDRGMIFRIPGGTSTPDHVARVGVAAMFGDESGGEAAVERVVGLVARLFWLCGRFLPHALTSVVACIAWQDFGWGALKHT
jgi:short-subunit dehydrogenase